jgi:hypothetical protein
MKTALITSILAFTISNAVASNHTIKFDLNSIDNVVLLADSDSVKIDVNAPVISYGNKLYQMGIVIGTFDKKSSIAKAQLTIRIQIYDLNGKAVAEAVSAGVNASYAITIFSTNEKLSMNLNFDKEAEELALKLRQKGIL